METITQNAQKQDEQNLKDPYRIAREALEEAGRKIPVPLVKVIAADLYEKAMDQLGILGAPDAPFRIRSIRFPKSVVSLSLVAESASHLPFPYKNRLKTVKLPPI